MTADLLRSETNCCSAPCPRIRRQVPHIWRSYLAGGGSANSRVSVHSGREDSVNTLGGDLSLGSEEQCHNHTDVFTP